MHTLQHTATLCLEHTATQTNTHSATQCNTVQHTTLSFCTISTCVYNTAQHTSTLSTSNTLQHTATHTLTTTRCNTLPCRFAPPRPASATPPLAVRAQRCACRQPCATHAPPASPTWEIFSNVNSIANIFGTLSIHKTLDMRQITCYI